ncbi:coiled-coil domain-containing protein 57-like [Mizuhopecten yessoensis]|uniref:Coiled-coil domain-containing protein 57 n=1 Tax=Mizuhopecten yessoensis TaxID=6573 RepID=A0A210QNK4_MIZYE|nr:coiled-coil domain-containing protein 57-like [Mizuhopecten yessoensis]OWF50285.1 Coiled-coil domain-containing protein 57 [Mizuhopecten yessoensis]
MADQDENWKELAAQKEREWKEVTNLRMQTLEAAYKDKDRQLQEEKAKFTKLKEDFKYNLKVLEERDKELETYDLTFSELKSSLNVKNGEISEMKIKLDDMKTWSDRENQAREELQLHYQQRLKEKQAEIDSYRCSKDSELQQERKEFENFKRTLQRKLTEVEEELDTQRRELSAEFDDALKRREHEFRLQTDEMSTKVLEYELKAKLLGKEMEMMKDAQDRNTQDYSEVERNHRQLEKALKEKDWELADLSAMKDARISDLEKQLEQSEVSMNRMKEDFQRKHSEMDRYGREKEAALAKVKEGYADREQSLSTKIKELQSSIEDNQVEIRKLQWARQDLEKEKDLQTQKLQDELCEVKEKWDKHVTNMSRSQVNKDLELEALRENEAKLKTDLQQRKEDIERYKKELSLAVERENSLERSKAQLELDWQRRFEDLERQQYEKSEDFVKKLTRGRDEALATVKEKERELQHRETLIRTLYHDREQALATLRKHGIAVEKNNKIDMEKVWLTANSEDVESLQKQNNSLKSVIKEMRMQMENLGQDLPAPHRDLESAGHPEIKDQDYVENLQKEVRSLRKKIRDLESLVEEGKRYGKIPVSTSSASEQEVMAEVKDNPTLRHHISSLNENIGAFRSEKVELSAQVKKQQARIQHLEKTVEQLSKEPRQKQVEVDQLRYDLSARERRSQAEIASMRQRVSDLEMQLAESRKESDEYYRSNLERNMEVTGLRQEISALKLDMADKRPTVNFGAQELMIQQLEDEISRLRQQAPVPEGSVDLSWNGPTKNSTVELQAKLKVAAKHIAQLAKEKQQLIEMGNRLRADLKKAGVNPSHGPPTSVASTNNQNVMSQEMLSRLGQLESLQYQLTRQQLQYAQKFPPTKHEERDVDSEVEGRPPSILKKSIDFAETDDIIDVRASHDTLDSRRSGITDSSRAPSYQGNTSQTREQFLMSMSSVGGESLQEIWKMMEERPSPSPFTPHYLDKHGEYPTNNSNQSLDSSGELVLKGRKPSMVVRNKSDTKLTERAAGKKGAAKNVRKPKIRNYNDTGVR